MGISRGKIGTSEVIELGDFKRMIGLKETSYRSITDFKSKILGKVTNELIKAGYIVTMEVVGKKEGKSVKINYHGKTPKLKTKED